VSPGASERRPGAGPGRAGLPARPPPVAIPPRLAATLVLVRHGESEDLAAGRFQGWRETPLSALGRRQAALAGARLVDPAAPPRLPVPAGEPLAVVHSPLQRTSETAAAISVAFAAAGRPLPPLVPEAGLREVGQGTWEGLLQAEVEARYPELIAGWRREPALFHAPGGESLAAVDDRARAALGRVVDMLAAAAGLDAAGRAAPLAAGSFYAPQTGPWTIVVGHDGVFKVLLMALLGLPLERFWSFTQATTGIAVIDLRNERAVVRAWNRTEHLAPLEADLADEERRSEERAADRDRGGAL